VQQPAEQQNNLINTAVKPVFWLAGVRYRLSHPFRRRHSAPRQLLKKLPQQEAHSKQMSFTFAAIALSARVACAGGTLTPRKYLRFRESFPLQDGVCEKIRSLFILACHNPSPLSTSIAQVKYAFPGKPSLLVSLMDRLFGIAVADGEISAAAERMLADIAHGLDISARDYNRLLSQHLKPRRPHYVLGIDKRSNRDALKSRYRDLMRRYHPDRFAGQPLSQEMELLLQLKTAEINDAYNALSKPLAKRAA
jgi:DnaJ like chaperone protein